MPFTVEQFLDVFAAYNKAVYPGQIILIFAALTAIFLALYRYQYSSKAIALILTIFWLWSALTYHLLFFTGINRLAYIFAALFILPAAIFFYTGVWTDQLRFRFSPNKYGFAGAIILLYSLLLYPILGYLFGHFYPRSPTFGVPCPTAIFMFGILLWTDKAVPFYVLIIPFLWSMLGISAAMSLGITEDFGLFTAAFASLALLFRKDPGDFSGI